jgi:hypothetical protein
MPRAPTPITAGMVHISQGGSIDPMVPLDEESEPLLAGAGEGVGDGLGLALGLGLGDAVGGGGASAGSKTLSKAGGRATSRTALCTPSLSTRILPVGPTEMPSPWGWSGSRKAPTRCNPGRV